MRVFFRLPDAACYVAACVLDPIRVQRVALRGIRRKSRLRRRHSPADMSVLLGTLFERVLLARRPESADQS